MRRALLALAGKELGRARFADRDAAARPDDAD